MNTEGKKIVNKEDSIIGLTINKNIFEMGFVDFKTEFNAIENDCIGKAITDVLLYEVSERYQRLFKHFGLQELQWRLIKGENSIIFTPIRTIDQYTINGMITQFKSPGISTKTDIETYINPKLHAIEFAEWVSNQKVLDDFWSMSFAVQEEAYELFLNQYKNK